MMKIKFYTGFVLSAALLISLFIGNSCHVPKPCKGQITVMDSVGTTPQPGVSVKLYATVTTATGSVIADLKAEQITDLDGKVFFTMKLPTIMDIKAEKPNCAPTPGSGGIPGSYCSGKGIIKFEEGNTTNKVVYLRQ